MHLTLLACRTALWHSICLPSQIIFKPNKALFKPVIVTTTVAISFIIASMATPWSKQSASQGAHYDDFRGHVSIGSGRPG